MVLQPGWEAAELLAADGEVGDPDSPGGPAEAFHDESQAKPASPLKLSLQVFLQNKLAILGLVTIVVMICFCFLGPFFYHTDQVSTNILAINLAPGSGHPLGTDLNGYDELGRLMIGGQTSLEVGIAAAAGATLIGVVWGAVSGFLGGIVDSIMMRIVDALLSIPALFLLLLLADIVKTSKVELIVVIAFIAWLVPARLVRGETLTLRVREYVQAVRTMGGRSPRIVFRHIIPNTIGTIVVNASFQVADAILTVAFLGFLGLALPPPGTDWGTMLSNGVNYTYDGYWWLIYPPGIAIVLTVVAFNFVGDALRDALEVRLRRR
jgi:peptide/nickel transport system permease protein